MTRSRQKPTAATWGRRALGLVVFIVMVVAAFAIHDSLVYKSPYNWSNLRMASGRPVYMENGEAASQIGIDVSEHNNAIDWTAVANDGIDFAFVRIGNRGYTEGALYADARFDENYARARAQGIAVGIYFFSQATSVAEAREEADFVLEMLSGRPLDLPVVYDFETVADQDGRANGVDRATLSSCAAAFCQRIEQGGYRAMVYMNRSLSDRYDMVKLYGYPIWYAEYGVQHPDNALRLDFSIWQYTSTGAVAGISGSADMNILFLNASQPVYGD